MNKNNNHQARSYLALSCDRLHPGHSQLPPQLSLVAHELSVRIAPEIDPLSQHALFPILQILSPEIMCANQDSRVHQSGFRSMQNLAALPIFNT